MLPLRYFLRIFNKSKIKSFFSLKIVPKFKTSDDKKSRFPKYGNEYSDAHGIDLQRELLICESYDPLKSGLRSAKYIAAMFQNKLLNLVCPKQLALIFHGPFRSTFSKDTIRFLL